MPSTKSSVAAQAPKLMASALSCSDNVCRDDSRSKRLALRMAMTGPVTSESDQGGDSAREVGGGHHAIDQTEFQRTFGVEAFAQKQDLHRASHANETRQRPRSTAVRRECDVSIGRCEVGVVGGDDQIAGIHERQPESRDGPMDLADHRMRHAVKVLDSRMQPTDHTLEARIALSRRLPSSAANVRKSPPP